MDADDLSSLDHLGELFDSLSQPELARLRFRSTVRRVAAGDLLAKQGDRGDEVYLILQGSVQVEAAVPGHAQPEVLAQLSEGDFVGEMVLLGQYYRSASVRALDDALVLAWKKNDLDEVFDEHHHIGYVVMRNLATMLCERLGATDTSLITQIAGGHQPGRSEA